MGLSLISPSLDETTVFLVRHGESVNNVLGVLGFMKWVVDPPLTARGREQALALREKFIEAKIFDTFNLKKVYCSPLTRAMQTAAIATAPLPLVVMPMFSEHRTSCGDIGRPLAELRADT